MSSESRRPPEALIFDLGGVLVDWAGIGEVAALTGGRLDIDSARRYWLASPWVRAFESGRGGAEEFCAGVVGDLSLEITPEEFLRRFVSWDRGPFPGARELLDSLRGRYMLACMSNNNPLHWERLRRPDMFGGRFDHYFISYETGLMKPDAAAFDHVLGRLGIRPKQALFFDDSPECIEGAQRLGIRGRLARGIDELRAALESEGVRIDINR